MEPIFNTNTANFALLPPKKQIYFVTGTWMRNLTKVVQDFRKNYLVLDALGYRELAPPQWDREKPAAILYGFRRPAAVRRSNFRRFEFSSGWTGRSRARRTRAVVPRGNVAGDRGG